MPCHGCRPSLRHAQILSPDGLLSTSLLSFMRQPRRPSLSKRRKTTTINCIYIYIYIHIQRAQWSEYMYMHIYIYIHKISIYIYIHVYLSGILTRSSRLNVDSHLGRETRKVDQSEGRQGEDSQEGAVDIVALFARCGCWFILWVTESTLFSRLLDRLIDCLIA